MSNFSDSIYQSLLYSIETSSYLAYSPIGSGLEKIAEPGAGVVLRTGDAMTPSYDLEALCLAHVSALNFKNKIQQIRMSGSSCEASLYYALGYRAAGICLPLIAWHNNGELEGENKLVREGIHIDDLASGTEFLVNIPETLSSMPELYRSLGPHDLLPNHIKLIRIKSKQFSQLKDLF